MAFSPIAMAKCGLAVGWLAAVCLCADRAIELSLHIKPPLAPPPAASSDNGYSRRDFLHSAQTLAPAGRARARAFADAIEAARLLPRDAQTQAQWAATSNARIFDYASDIEVWGIQDYWATPLEFADKGRGDCEDFAIAARALLYSAGFPKNKLAMAYARLDSDGLVIPHMVLLVRDGEESWVVDNTRLDATKLSERHDLEIVFTYDEESVFLRVDQKNVGSSRQRIPHWNDLLLRSAQIGFR